jgi:plasmid stabilization system protein ParE
MVALDGLEQACHYIAQDNPRTPERILGAARNLADLPEMGRVPGTRELVVSGTSYIVVYAVGGDHVTIMRFSSAQRWPERF